MNKLIDYYYAPISGYAYLGEKKLVALAEQAAATIHFRPVDIVKVFNHAQTTAPFKQSPARLNYRYQDMRRIAKKNELAINPKPKHWPVPVELAATSIYSADDLGYDTHRLSFAILSAVYTRELDVSDEVVLRGILDALNWDAEKILENRVTKKIQSLYEAATNTAMELGVFGSPTYVVNGELFFGQDRLDMLLDYLNDNLSP